VGEREGGGGRADVELLTPVVEVKLLPWGKERGELGWWCLERGEYRVAVPADTGTIDGLFEEGCGDELWSGVLLLGTEIWTEIDMMTDRKIFGR